MFIEVFTEYKTYTININNILALHRSASDNNITVLYLDQAVDGMNPMIVLEDYQEVVHKIRETQEIE